MENINIIEKLKLDDQLTLEDIPQLDLYMDQVIQLFENKFSSSTRNEDDKVLTKTMINNYAKGKLLFPIKNKKYSKEHLILIALIYQLKGALSINDIKETLKGLNKKVSEDNLDLDHFYRIYLNLADKNINTFKKDFNLKAANVKEEIEKLEEEQHSSEIEKVLMIASLINMSNFYRRAAELLVDELGEERAEESK